jgi:hypothetical protein
VLRNELETLVHDKKKKQDLNMVGVGLLSNMMVKFIVVNFVLTVVRNILFSLVDFFCCFNNNKCIVFIN